MEKLKSVLERERLRALREKARVALTQLWTLARKYGAIAGKYAGVFAREAWIVLQRLPIATVSFARALASADYAEELRTLHAHHASTPGVLAQRIPTAPAADLQQAPPDSALLLLNLLQKEGRFVDFVQEDVTHYADAEVGSAARVVHQGCRRVLREHLAVAPVRTESEGARVTLEPGFNPAEVRPTGQVVGEPPFTGTLVHRGWRATEIHLPQVASSRDLRVLAAAEVEL
jgi:hypothetical protein